MLASVTALSTRSLLDSFQALQPYAASLGFWERSELLRDAILRCCELLLEICPLLGVAPRWGADPAAHECRLDSRLLGFKL
jgi:hypothetical protein